MGGRGYWGCMRTGVLQPAWGASGEETLVGTDWFLDSGEGDGYFFEVVERKNRFCILNYVIIHSLKYLCYSSITLFHVFNVTN